MSMDIPAVWTQEEKYVIEPKTRTLRPAVLVVDDETSIRVFVSRVLQDSGYEVVVAGSGTEALERFNNMPRCDLLFTDYLMPNMNGDELARRLRLERPDLKILYLTGFSDRLFAEKMLLWNGEAFLDKPCSPKAAMEGVSLLLSGRLQSAVH